uniref:Palmitoyltransferase n=1 Tax=Eubosmina coregoni TaxID=186181 RepID=A0A4Y7LQI5_9CRUS|nr:EOG090X06RJ [Eubosmina coregoni]
MKLLSKFAALLNLITLKVTKRQTWKTIRQKLLHLPDVDWDTLTDRFIDPIIWIVDNFSDSIGKIFVSLVWSLIVFIVGVAYWIGLPFYWSISPTLSIPLVIFGNWILMNVVFHYYMGLITPPGNPPKAESIPHITAKCKKCQGPKPSRTHHCSICHTCILRMDHHCPWLNNCVGHFNHRYFFLFMAFVVIGMVFLIIFGLPVAYHELWNEDNGEPIGRRVIRDGSQLIPLDDNEIPEESQTPKWRRAVIATVAVLVGGIFLALGALVAWHARLITRGETSIENLTNKDARQAAKLASRVFVNPHDHGAKENWRIFFGLSEGRSWKCVFFPSAHPPRGDGFYLNKNEATDLECNFVLTHVS